MAKKRILLIDDDTWLAELMGRALTKAGYGVSMVHNALEGMQRIDTYKPHLIVLDLFMPGPNGIVLLHEMQSYSDTAAIPVVLCTNSAGDLPSETFAPYGVRRVLDKATMEPADIVAAARRFA